jgi:hypothetical protein
VLTFRKAELEDRGRIEDWRLEVIFVAHEFRGNLPDTADISGMPVTITYQIYEDFAPDAISDEMVETFNEVFVSRINAIETPHRVRQVAHDVVTVAA